MIIVDNHLISWISILNRLIIFYLLNYFFFYNYLIVHWNLSDSLSILLVMDYGMANNLIRCLICVLIICMYLLLWIINCLIPDNVIYWWLMNGIAYNLCFIMCCWYLIGIIGNYNGRTLCSYNLILFISLR